MSYLDVVSPLRRDQFTEMDQVTRRMLGREQPPPEIPDFAQEMTPKARSIFEECYRSRPYYRWSGPDLALLSDYANLIVELHDELDNYKSEGSIIYNQQNGEPRINPRRAVINKVRSEIRIALKELNLSPGYLMRRSFDQFNTERKKDEKTNEAIDDITGSDGLLASPVVLNG